VVSAGSFVRFILSYSSRFCKIKRRNVLRPRLASAPRERGEEAAVTEAVLRNVKNAGQISTEVTKFILGKDWILKAQGDKIKNN
jgi:hypothetical protein